MSHRQRTELDSAGSSNSGVYGRDNGLDGNLAAVKWLINARRAGCE